MQIANEMNITDRPQDLTETDTGSVVLYHPNGVTVAVAPTLAECLAIANDIFPDSQRDDDEETGYRELREYDICTDADWDLSQLCAAIVTN